jgi:hypothetical protein
MDLYIDRPENITMTCGVGRWFSSGTPVTSINKIDRRDIAKILLKENLNTLILFI